MCGVHCWTYGSDFSHPNINWSLTSTLNLMLTPINTTEDTQQQTGRNMEQTKSSCFFFHSTTKLFEVQICGTSVQLSSADGADGQTSGEQLPEHLLLPALAQPLPLQSGVIFLSADARSLPLHYYLHYFSSTRPWERALIIFPNPKSGVAKLYSRTQAKKLNKIRPELWITFFLIPFCFVSIVFSIV